MSPLPLIIAGLAGFVAWGLVYYGWTLWEVMATTKKTRPTEDSDSDLDEGAL